MREGLMEERLEAGGCIGQGCQTALQRVAACPFLSCVCLVLALLMVLRILRCLVGGLCSLSKRIFGGGSLSHYGEWAVVTGASDGVGKAMAIELAKTRGIKNILLVARNDAKLQEVASEVEKAGGTTRRLVVDFFRDAPEEILKKLTEATHNLSVGVLINNAGISYPHPMFSEEVDIALIQELLLVNVRSVFLVTQALLPGMKARGKGLIINVGSGSSVIPSDPLYAMYSATKAAVENFSRNLGVELLRSGIRVQCHVPLLITTKLSKCKTPSLCIPDAKTYAAAAVNSMKYVGCCSPPSVSPYWLHAIVLVLIGFLPRASWNKLRLKQCLAMRVKALEKKNTHKKET